MSDAAVYAFVAALEARGWKLVGTTNPAGGRQPTEVEFRRRAKHVRFLVYGWNCTGEGKGRAKDDLRIQTTRAHDSPLLFPPGAATLGLAWHEDYGVTGAFDAWAKRFAGWSSSVHFHRALFDVALTEGFATEVRDDVAECAFRPERVHEYLAWLSALARPRLIRTQPDGAVRNGDVARLRFENPTRRYTRRATWLRPGDYLALSGVTDEFEGSIWRVTDISPEPSPGVVSDDLDALVVTSRRHGLVRDSTLLTGEGTARG